MTPTGGSHGKSHRTTKILSHASRRRGGRVAGGDVGAAAGEATDHRVLGLRLRPMAIGSLLFCSGCAYSAGSKVATSSSSIAGRREAAIAPPCSRPSSSDSKSILLSHMQSQWFSQQSRRHRLFAAAADPVGTGLVASLARPGGNVTGLSAQHTELAGKRLALLR